MNPENMHRIVWARLSGRQEHRFDLRPETAQIDRIAQALDLLALRKVRFRGKLVPEGTRDWRLEAQLGATVVQPCVVTLEPVTTRIEEPVERHYLADYAAPEGAEIEMDADDTLEPLRDEVDLMAVLEEALALSLPSWPRAEGAEMQAIAVTEPGADPLTDRDVKPFAGLKALRDRLADKEG